MTPKQAIVTDQAPAAVGPYSQAIKQGNLVFTAGQLPLTVAGELVSDEIAAQTKQVMDNLAVVLAAAGANFSQVVKTTIYVTDMADFATVNEVYSSYLTAPYPARETVQIGALARQAKVEISMIAAL